MSVAKSVKGRRVPFTPIRALAIAAAAAVLGIVVYWGVKYANEQDALKTKPTDATAVSAPPQLAASTPAPAAIPPSADLAVAIQQAVAKTNLPPRPPPKGQTSWQGMSSADAAKAFEAAVATSANSPAAANPFGSEGTAQKAQANAR
jgi:hypothetical protein